MLSSRMLHIIAALLAIATPVLSQQASSISSAITTSSSSDPTSAGGIKSTPTSFGTSSAQFSQATTTGATISVAGTIVRSVSEHGSKTSSVPMSTAQTTYPGKGMVQQSGLPLQPKITPVLAIAGVLMLFSGVAYAAIGVRKQWLHIFGSTAYSVALAIIVLITYVSNPPVSTALQGAYLVAAVVPAFIFGGIALIFRDVVEGLGCLLGGFCVSMWLLVWKDGGLITSSGGKLGLILAFTIGAFLLFFSRHTRLYALISGTSIAGATVIVLGIDCFSRAGLKEFWIYLWNLNNDDIFPLHTTTYPRTRAIAAENAGILVIAILGIISQSKLWGTVSDHRERRAQDRLRDLEEHEHLDTQAGRRIESRNGRDLAKWKATNETQSASSEVSVSNTTAASSCPSHSFVGKKDRLSVQEIEVVPSPTDIELSKLTSTGAKEPVLGASSSFEKSNPHLSSSQAQKDQTTIREAPSEVSNCSTRTSTSSKRYVVSGSHDEGQWEEVKQPPITFEATSEAPGKSNDKSPDRTEDTAGAAIDRCDSSVISRCSSYLGKSTNMGETCHSLKSTTIPQSDDEEDSIASETPSRRSSVAATLDALTEHNGSLPALSRPASVMMLQAEYPAQASDGSLQRRHSLTLLQHDNCKLKSSIKEDSTESHRRHSVAGINIAPDSKLGSLANLPHGDRRQDFEGDSVNVNTALQNDITEKVSSPLPSTGLTKEHLPQAQSNTVMLYRTNEWAKHQALADKPAVEEVAPVTKRIANSNSTREATMPVNVSDLQATAFTPQAAAPSRSASQTHQKSSNPPVSRSTANASIPVTKSSRQSTTFYTPSMVRSLSNPVMTPSAFDRHTTGRRSTQPILEPPREDSTSPMSFDSRQEPSLAQLARSTKLTNGRRSLLTKRASLTNNDSRPLSEDMTLAQRRDSLRQQRYPRNSTASPTNRGSATLSLGRSSSTPHQQLMSARNPARVMSMPSQSRLRSVSYAHHSSQPQPQDPHQPPHGATLPALQPGSTNALAQTPQNRLSASQPQQQLRHSQSQEAARQRLREQELLRRESARVERIQRGNWERAHRSALRKMEAGVGK